MATQAQTERITILSTPEFKSWISKEAQKEGLSMGELIRKRCMNQPSEDEMLLAALIPEVRAAIKKSSQNLNSSLLEAQAMLNELKMKREKHESC